MNIYLVSYMWKGEPRQVKMRALSIAHARIMCRAHKIPGSPIIREQGELKF